MPNAGSWGEGRKSSWLRAVVAGEDQSLGFSLGLRVRGFVLRSGGSGLVRLGLGLKALAAPSSTSSAAAAAVCSTFM